MSTANLFELPIYYQYGIGSAGFNAWRELYTHIITTDWVIRNKCPNFPRMYHWRILPRSISEAQEIFEKRYNLRLVYQSPTINSLNLVKQGELGLFCKGHKLFYKVYGRKKRQIIRSDDASVKGLDTETFDKIIKVMQEGQKQQSIVKHNNIMKEDRTKLLQFILWDSNTLELNSSVDHWGGELTIRMRLEAIANASANLVLFLEYIPETLEQWLDRQFVKEGNINESSILIIEKNLKAITNFIRKHGLLHCDAHFKNILTDGHRLYLTDFGLATSSTFELTDTEVQFIKTHRYYDQLYTSGLWAAWISKILFGKNNFKIKLYEYITRTEKEEKLLSPITRKILRRDGQNWITMDTFLKQMQKKIRMGKEITLWKQAYQSHCCKISL